MARWNYKFGGVEYTQRIRDNLDYGTYGSSQQQSQANSWSSIIPFCRLGNSLSETSLNYAWNFLVAVVSGKKNWTYYNYFESLHLSLLWRFIIILASTSFRLYITVSVTEGAHHHPPTNWNCKPGSSITFDCLKLPIETINWICNYPLGLSVSTLLAIMRIQLYLEERRTTLVISTSMEHREDCCQDVEEGRRRRWRSRKMMMSTMNFPSRFLQGVLICAAKVIHLICVFIFIIKLYRDFNLVKTPNILIDDTYLAGNCAQCPLAKKRLFQFLKWQFSFLRPK